MEESCLDKELWNKEFTLDDVIIAPSKIPRGLELRDINLSTSASPGLRLNIPLISAAMDTVTGFRMAELLAREGGVGMIHYNFPDEDAQMAEVERVRRSQASFVRTPVVLGVDSTVREMLEYERRYGFSSFPITADGSIGSELLGMVTKKDFELKEDITLTAGQVMTPRSKLHTEGRSILDSNNIQLAKQIVDNKRLDTLPILEGDRLVALFTRGDFLKQNRYPLATKDENNQLKVVVAVESRMNDVVRTRVEKAFGLGVSAIKVDARNLYGDHLDIAKWVKANFPMMDVVLGNVVRPEVAMDALFEAGGCIDAFCVGIGTGDVCTTTEDLSFGGSMGRALYGISSRLAGQGFRDKKRYVSLWADGGIKTPGHIALALALGADAVVMGSEFAGFDESPTVARWINGRYVKRVRGMGSEAVIRERAGAFRYMADQIMDDAFAEGIEKETAYKGPGRPHIARLIAGLRRVLQGSGCGDIASFRRDVKIVPRIRAVSKGSS